MGCCQPLNSSDGLELLLGKGYGDSFPQRFSLLLQSGKFPELSKDIDCELTIGQESTTVLAYTLNNGKTAQFRLLVSQFGASLESLEHFLCKQRKTTIELICERGYTELLEYYLPLYTPRTHSEIEFTLDFEHSIDTDKEPKFSPVQLASLNNHFGVLEVLQKHFAGAQPPTELDMDAQDELTGDACVTFAAKDGNLQALASLQHLGANFFIVNKRGESLIQIAAAWSKKKPDTDYYTVIKYLIEDIGLDPVYNYEETLLVVQEPRIVKYLEKKLHERDVHQGKTELEALNRIHSPVRVLSAQEVKEIVWAKFDCEYLRSDGDASNMSSISVESLPRTPFLSGLITSE